MNLPAKIRNMSKRRQKIANAKWLHENLRDALSKLLGNDEPIYWNQNAHPILQKAFDETFAKFGPPKGWEIVKDSAKYDREQRSLSVTLAPSTRSNIAQACDPQKDQG